MTVYQDEAKQRLLDEELGSPLLQLPSRSGSPIRLSGNPSSRRRVLFGILATLSLCYFASRRTAPQPLSSYQEAFHLAPRFPLQPADNLVHQPTAEHTVTAILLHGLGDIYRTTPVALTAVLAERYDYVKW